jgi:hypothetical protein
MSSRFVGLDVARVTRHGTALRGSPRGRLVAVAMALLAAALFALTLPGPAHAEVGEAPEVINQNPTGVGRTTAILEGLVNPNGAEITECEFEYGTSPGELNQTAPCIPFPEAGENLVPVSAPVKGLSESTKYYYRVVAVSEFGEGIASPVKAFTTLPTAPHVVTDTPEEITRTSANLQGAVNPNDSNVEECEFEYATTPNYESPTFVNCQVLPGSGEKQVKVHAVANALVQHTKYYVRLIAKNSFGQSFGASLEFKTPPTKPAITTEKPTVIGKHSATFRAVVNPQGAEVTVCEFEYGTSPALGSRTSCASLPGNGESGVHVSAEVGGLAESTIYYYRAVATNEDGTKFGNTVKFSTYPSPPKVSTLGASHITSDSAQLNGNVNPDASNVTSCEFEYGTSLEYGKRASCSSLPGEGEMPVAVSAALAHLSGSTTYDFRIVAKNSHGTSFGSNVRFKTPVAGERPTITKLSPNKGWTLGGQTVKIKGTGFTEETSVLFGTTPAASVTVKNGDTLVVVTPPEEAGMVEVSVSTEAGTSEATEADHFTYKVKPVKK